MTPVMFLSENTHMGLKRLLLRRVPVYSHYKRVRHPLPLPRTRRALRSKRRR